jgi:hypothetical protein
MQVKKLGYWAALSSKVSHFPLLFYTAWLSFAKYKLDGKGEIKELVLGMRSTQV